MSTHDQWADAVGAYLLDALPDDERERFELHLEDCAACREDVDALRVAADALPVAVPQMEPPPELKARIMGVVRAEARLLEAAGERADLPEAPSAPARREPWWRGFTLRPALAAAAAAVLLLVGGLAGALVRGGDGGADRVVAEVDERVAPAATVALELDGDNATLVASNLPAPPSGRVYQVWVQRGGRPEPTDTLFVPRSDGSARAALPPGAADAEAVLVTSEPLGGSEEPSRAPFVSVQPA